MRSQTSRSQTDERVSDEWVSLLSYFIDVTLEQVRRLADQSIRRRGPFQVDRNIAIADQKQEKKKS